LSVWNSAAETTSSGSLNIHVTRRISKNGRVVPLFGALLMKYPSNQEFKSFFKGLPKWVLWLILLLIFGRFIIVGLWKIFQ
jgi:hypothetical protein